MASPGSDSQKQIFSQLKPRCVEVSQIALAAQASPGSPARLGLAQRLTSALEALLQTINQIPDPETTLTPALGDYVFFPLSYIFRQYQSLSDRVLELSLEILHVLITTSWKVNIAKELAKQLLILVTFIVGGSPTSASASHRASEECRIAGCKCFAGLFRALTASDIARRAFFTDAQNIPAIGHTVSTVLDTLVTYNDSVQLGLVCIEALEVLYWNLIEDLDVIACFYPGTVSQICKLLTPSTKTRTSYKLIFRSIDLLREVSTKLLADDVTSDLPSGDYSRGPPVGASQGETLKTKRTASWYKATSMQTKLAIQGVLAQTRSHPKLEVRMAIFRLCRELLQNCYKALEISEGLEPIIETLLVLSGEGEENSDLSRLSEESLRKAVVSIPTVADTLQQSLRGWITSMPRIMQSNDEDKKVKVASRISAGFSVLNTLGLESTVLHEMIARSLEDSLRASNAFSASDRITMEAEVNDLAVALTPGTNLIPAVPVNNLYPELVFGHRSQIETVKSLKKLFYRMGAVAPASTVQLASRYIREAEGGSPIALWIALHLLRALSISSSVVDQFLEGLDVLPPAALQQLLMNELFPISLSILTNSTTAAVEMSEIPGEQLSRCLALESIALIAEKQGVDFRHEMVDVLYPVVHLLGSPSALVQRHAIITLNKLASSCFYPSPKDLILDNVDYLINAIALKLNTFDISPQAPMVLRMMVRLTGKKLIPFLDDLVESIFGSLANYHGYEVLCRGLFEVLKEIVEVEAGLENKLKLIERGDTGPRKRNYKLTNEELLEILAGNEERIKRARLNEERQAADEEIKVEFPREPWGEKDADQPNSDYPMGEEGENTETAVAAPREVASEVPKTYKIIQNISRLTQHYLSHPSSSFRLQLLQLISTSSHYLSNIEDEFLPLVNDIWPVLFSRLFDDEAHVVIGAATTIADLATTSGDFLTSRVEEGWKDSAVNGKGVRRLLLGIKERLSKERKGNAGRGVHSRDYQMWDALLRMMAAVVRNCKVNEEIISELLEITGDVLEEIAVLKDALEYVNEDAVWLELESRKKHGSGDSCRLGKPHVEGYIFCEVLF